MATTTIHQAPCNVASDCWNLLHLHSQIIMEPLQILGTFELNLQVPSL